jgi:hypothetical protein
MVPKSLCEAKETIGEQEELLVTSVVNPSSTLDLVPKLNLSFDWRPFVKIFQTSLGNKHYCNKDYGKSFRLN